MIIINFILETIHSIEQRQRCGAQPILKIDRNIAEIQVYSENIGEPPHFHVVCNNNYKKDNYCFKILKNESYPHGNHKNILTKHKLKQLNKVLSNDNYKVWKEIIQVWNKNNPNNLIDINLKFKNYE